MGHLDSLGYFAVFVPECTMHETYLPGSTCQLSPLLSRFSYNVKFRDKFAFVNGTRLKDISITLAENQSKGIPFRLEDGKDTGGSLAVRLKMKQIINIAVCALYFGFKHSK